MLDHLLGISFRSLGQKGGVCGSTAYRRYLKEVSCIPHCLDVTRKYCSKFCGILLVDGKFVSVKSYSRKLPVVYGIDYLTHDIPHYLLSVSESYQTLHKFFASLRLANYPLQALVSDDNQNIREACLSVYPKAVTQLCHNHYKQNVRASLGLYQNLTYLSFMREVETLFDKKISPDDYKQRALKIYKFWQKDELPQKIMLEMAQRLPELMAYTKLKNTPRTNNLIESFNSHLEGRLKTIKGFQSFKHADTWLNLYFLARRAKPFTDCTGKFRGLNHQTSLQQTLSSNHKFEEVLKLIR